MSVCIYIYEIANFSFQFHFFSSTYEYEYEYDRRASANGLRSFALLPLTNSSQLDSQREALHLPRLEPSCPARIADTLAFEGRGRSSTCSRPSSR